MLLIEKLNVAYGSHLALHDFSLSVQPGEIVALIGPNGAGKSTLIRAISGVLSVRSGTIHFQEHDLIAASENQRARLVSVVPQARQLGGAFSVEEVVMLGRTPYMGWLGHSDEEDQHAMRIAMRRAALDEFAERRVAELSGGEQQRVLLARALAQATPVMLLDEPTNHLDLQHQVNFLNLIRELAAEQNLAVLLAMHDLNLVSLYADRVALIVEGRLQTVGEPAQVITEEHISAAFGTSVQIVHAQNSDAALILPRLDDK